MSRGPVYVPRGYWDERARAQGPSYVGPGGRPAKTEAQAATFNRVIAARLAGRRFGRVLDFGCGAGRFAPLLAAHAGSYVGVDISRPGILYAQAAHPGADFRLMPEDRIPLPTGWADLVVAITVLQHIVSDDDWRIWTAEIARVLARGGSVLIVDAAPRAGAEPPAPHVARRGVADYSAIGAARRVGEVSGHHVIEIVPGAPTDSVAPSEGGALGFGDGDTAPREPDCGSPIGGRP